MVNSSKTRLLNLYVDESGTFSLTEARYRYFILAGVILSKSQHELLNLLLSKWRTKYLSNSDLAFHTTDFFEDFEKDYKRPHLKIEKHFKIAVEELIDLIKMVDFKASVYYVDLPKLRNKLSVSEPPTYQSKFDSQQEKKNYKKSTKDYKIMLENNRIDHLLPLAITQFALFKWHAEELIEAEKGNTRNTKEYINFESLSGSDVESVKNYHRLKNKINKYNEKIIGLNFHTKNSIDGGLELADIISYISCQTLRLKYCKTELGKLAQNEHLKEEIRKLRKEMRDRFQIKITDVTDEDI